MTNASPPRGIVHVGAHHGQEIDEYQSYGLDCLIWIEADPRSFTKMQEYLFAREIPATEHICLNALISDRDGDDQDFHVAMDNGQSSSMFPSTDLFTKIFPKHGPSGEVLQLTTRSLQSVLSDINVQPGQIDYLVLDTQGAEMKCLAGLGPYINGLRFIAAEASTISLYDGGAQLSEIDSYLEPRGFIRVSVDPEYQHGDVLYVLRSNEYGKGIAASYVTERDIAMRAQFNEIIGALNQRHARTDSSDMEGRFLNFLEEFRDILSAPQSVEICALCARLTFAGTMRQAFPGFLGLLQRP